MPVGGAETLLANLVCRMDKDRFLPHIGCLKQLDEVGQELSSEFPAFENLLNSKYDLRVFNRLNDILKTNRIDAIVTVGAGDKMFWGRLCAKHCNLPVVLSALHSTGWPDVIGRMNRWLTGITDGFIGVAPRHGDYLEKEEGFPPEKIFVIPNGIDTDRFQPQPGGQVLLRQELGLPVETPLCGIVAALRPEKNHDLFLEVGRLVCETRPDTHFVIVGNGEERDRLKSVAREKNIDDRVHFLGTRKDIVEILTALDVFMLTSHMEANPVSILEALSVKVPVVATDVGSVSMTVKPGITGFLSPAGDADQMSKHVLNLLADPTLCSKLGEAGRKEVIDNWSLETMVRGYEDLITKIYESKVTPSDEPSLDAVGVNASKVDEQIPTHA